MSGPVPPPPAIDWSAVFRALGIDPLAGGLQIVSAAALAPAPPLPRATEVTLSPGGPPLDRLLYAPLSFDPTRPLLVFAADRGAVQPAIAAIRQEYPAAHRVTTLDEGHAPQEMALQELTTFDYLFLPSLALLDVPWACDTLRYIVARLRGPDGCPWDREQTHASLKPYLIEEAYETLEALEEANALKLREELGDLLLQILLHAQLAAESGHFDLGAVIDGLSRKLIRRHPHVFGEVQVASAQQVLANWDAIKRSEGTESLLSGVPKAMPALAYAQSIQRRAARAGFDWPDINGVLDKVAEEARELKESPDNEWELGDLLFAVVNVARWLSVDAEEALRKASARFYRRFNWIEARCAERGVAMEGLSPAELDALWEQAKAAE